MKTRIKNKLYRFFVHDRVGYLKEDINVFDKLGTQIDCKENIKSMYFGFDFEYQADAFESYCLRTFPELSSFSSHCLVRESKRLPYPFEVKVRNLKDIEEKLLNLLEKCLMKS